VQLREQVQQRGGRATIIPPLTKLPSRLVNISPFSHHSPLPGGQFEVISAAMLTLLALLLVGVGYWAYHHRDVTWG
jgi:putative exporter of polyketide antibiotics